MSGTVAITDARVWKRERGAGRVRELLFIITNKARAKGGGSQKVSVL